MLRVHKAYKALLAHKVLLEQMEQTGIRIGLRRYQDLLNIREILFQ